MSTAPEKSVFRQIALPVSTFDWLKQCQRNYQAKHGQHLNNNEMLTMILREHKKLTEECGVRLNVTAYSEVST